MDKNKSDAPNSGNIKVNLKVLEVGKKNQNGRVYPKKVVQEALDTFFEKKDRIEIVNQVNDVDFEIILFKDIVGWVKKENLVMTKNSLRINEIIPMGVAGRALGNLIEQKVVEIAPFGIGEIDEKGKVTEYKMIGMQVAPNQD
jgi:hypothetical protein